MVSKEQITLFLQQKHIAVAGASAKGKGFGNMVIDTLTGNGYSVYPVHPAAESINGVTACKSVNDLPAEVPALFIALKPADAAKVVQEAVAKGIRHIWIQQQSESPEAIALCEQAGVQLVYGQCVVMFLQQISFPHRLHRFFAKLGGKMPV